MKKNELGFTFNQVYLHIARQLKIDQRKLKDCGYVPYKDRGNKKP